MTLSLLFHGLWTPYPKCHALRDLVPFVKFKKRDNQPWGRVTFSKVAGFTKSRKT